MSTAPRAAPAEALPRQPAVATEPAAGSPVRQRSLWRDAWHRYVRNHAAVVAGAAFLVILLYCLLWPELSPRR